MALTCVHTDIHGAGNWVMGNLNLTERPAWGWSLWPAVLHASYGLNSISEVDAAPAPGRLVTPDRLRLRPRPTRPVPRPRASALRLSSSALALR